MFNEISPYVLVAVVQNLSYIYEYFVYINLCRRMGSYNIERKKIKCKIDKYKNDSKNNLLNDQLMENIYITQ